MARPDSEYTEELVDEQILALRRRHAVLEPVERVPEMNDRITADIRANVEDNEVLNEQATEFHLREGQSVGVPGLMERLVGLEVGVEHEIEIDVDEDWDDEEVAGKTVMFKATIHDVKHDGACPNRDDDFAMEVSDEFETFAELRDRIAEQLREQTDRQAEELLRRSVLRGGDCEVDAGVPAGARGARGRAHAAGLRAADGPGPGDVPAGLGRTGRAAAGQLPLAGQRASDQHAGAATHCGG